ncbi:MAG: glycosyltransferase family 2 protein [Propionibacteriaceae bacterium]|nr:glycosyltransferase family 2 protein [Propionibacteriaceae bacterium]
MTVTPVSTTPARALDYVPAASTPLKKLTIVIPCYNEADSIHELILAIPHERLRAIGVETRVLVVDNNSSDSTADLARAAEAEVIFEGAQGKGHALRSAFRTIPEDTDFVAMLDGDNTYNPSELPRMIEPLVSGFADVVLGSRLGGRIREGSMRGVNRLGNWLFTFLVRTFCEANATDVLTGYFAWRKPVLDELRPHLQSSGFAIEMEMVTKMAALGHRVTSVPISYHPRLGSSSLNPVEDGLRILRCFATNLAWRPPAPKVVTG